MDEQERQALRERLEEEGVSEAVDPLEDDDDEVPADGQQPLTYLQRLRCQD